MDKETLERHRREYDLLTVELQKPEVLSDPNKMAALGRQQARLGEIVEKATELESVKERLRQNAQLINTESDPELVSLAVEENTELSRRAKELDDELEKLLLPRDPDDDKDIILEIRAGAGGEESALFAAELFRMYARFAESRGWKVSLLNANRTGIGGFKEVICEISSSGDTEGVYGYLKHESGVHRVQRIPETEKQGRVHTSTATVAVLPVAEEAEITIDPKDLRIDTFASSGPGGQSVNTTMSAVRITHLPSGIVVSCQDEKSQHKNKDKAMSVLRSRLKRLEEEKRAKELGEKRRSQIGTGDRSEKIRTYNVPQDRVTDHRLKSNWSNIKGILDGDLSEIIDSLRQEEVKRRREENGKNLRD